MTAKRSAGFTMIEMLVGIALFGLFVVLSTKISTDISNGLAQIKLRQEVTALKSSLRNQVNCVETLRTKLGADGVARCPTAGAITLKGGQGTALPAQQGAWTVAASCGPSGLSVQATRQSGSVVSKDPMSGAPLDSSNTSLNPILGNGTTHGLCASSFLTSSRVTIVTSMGAPFTPANCNLVKPVIPPPMPGNEPADVAAYKPRMLMAEAMDSACQTLCTTTHLKAGGYLADCNRSNGRGTCACYR